MGGTLIVSASNPVPVDQCVILLGGLGTRLGELTRDIPKPLLPVGERPFIDVLIGEAVRRGFRDILLLAGFRSEVVTDYVAGLKTRLPQGARVALSVEPEPLGTGGALAFARMQLAGRFLLLNGDTWFDFNWLDLLDVAGEGSVIAAREVPLADRYESLLVSPDGRVEAIVPRGAGASPALINGGVYLLHRDDLDGFSGKFSIEEDLLPALVARDRLRARSYNGFFLDIGVPETYAAAQIEIPARQRRPALFLDRDGVLNHDDNYVGSIECLRWIDGAAEAVRLANGLGFYVFVVTNQAGVARGFYDELAVATLHGEMAARLRASGATIDDWRYCPYHPEAILDAYRGVHPWRKPQPGMLLDLMDHWPVDVAASLLVGDQPTDLAAAQAAGISALQFAGGNLRDFIAPHLARIAARSFEGPVAS